MVEALKLLIWFLIHVYTFSWQTATDPNLYSSYTLGVVYDGDTISVRELPRPVRLIGVDTPEVRRVGWRSVGEYSKEASRFTKRFLKRTVHLDLKGRDRYGRYLAHVITDDGWLNYELVEEGLARIYFFRDTMDYRTYFLAHAYRKAFFNRKGVFSKYDNAPLLREGVNWRRYLGRIVWLEGTVKSFYRSYGYNDLDLGWALVAIRDEEYEIMFGNMLNLNGLVGKKIEVYGELYEYRGRPYMIVRSPFELGIVDEGL